jgi:hypothetical protein
MTRSSPGEEPWAQGFGTCIYPGLFDHVTTGTGR